MADDEWTNAQRKSWKAFTTKALKVPVLTNGKNPLPSHAIMQIVDVLRGLANRYEAVAKNPEFQRAGEWNRSRGLDTACESANKNLRRILERQSNIIDPPKRKPTRREVEAHDRMVERAKKMMRGSLGSPNANR